MRALKYILLFVLVFIIGSSIYVATLKADYDIKSTKTINVPVEIVFNEINDFKNWNNWGPWLEMDSTIVASYPEITSGVGASYSWTGKEGVGSMKTISVIPNQEIIQQIDFGTGSTPEVYWELNAVKNGTELTWGMRGKNSFSEKLYWLFNGGIEKNMTPMYTRGLELLNNHLLKYLGKYSVDFKGIVDFGGTFYLYKTTSSKINLINKKKVDMFKNIDKYMIENAIESNWHNFTLFHQWDEKNDVAIFSTCIPTQDKPLANEEILAGYIEPQKMFKTIFMGDYKFSKIAWDAAYKELEKQGFISPEKSEPFEVYNIGPKNTIDPTKWVLEIYIPIEYIPVPVVL